MSFEETEVRVRLTKAEVRRAIEYEHKRQIALARAADYAREVDRWRNKLNVLFRGEDWEAYVTALIIAYNLGVDA